MEYRPLENLEGKRLLLASHSPRRRELLGILGVDFDIAGDEILGKPSSEEKAREMLTKLSRKSHKVITGVTISTPAGRCSFSATTKVTFDNLSEEEINYYIEKYRPYDKAGAYGIQEWIGAVGIKGIEGSYYNVMGLPVHQLYKHLLTIS